MRAQQRHNESACEKRGGSEVFGTRASTREQARERKREIEREGAKAEWEKKRESEIGESQRERK